VPNARVAVEKDSEGKFSNTFETEMKLIGTEMKVIGTEAKFSATLKQFFWDAGESPEIYYYSLLEKNN